MSSCDNSNIKKNYIVTSTEIDILSACTGFYTNNIYPCSGDTITIESDILSTNTINSSVILSGGTNLLDIFGSSGGNTFITGFTYDNSNNLTIQRNDDVSFGVNISEFSGLTINGVLSACTGVYTTNLYGCSPITVQDELILLSGLTLSAITNDDTLSEILVRDSVTGLIKYRDVSSITPDTNTFVTGVTYTTDYAVLTRNDNVDVLKLSGGTNVVFNNPSPNEIVIDVTIPPDTNTFVTGFTYDDSNNLTINRNDGIDFSVNIDTMTGLTVNGTLSATTYFGDGSNLTGISSDDNFVTGGTFSSETLTLNRQNGSVTITGFTEDSNTFVSGGSYSDVTDIITFTNTTGSTFNVTGITDTFVTGFTYNDSNTFTIFDNDGSTFPATISQLSGLTVNGTLSATTLDGSILLSGGTNLLTIIESLDTNTFVSGGTYNDTTNNINFSGNSLDTTFDVDLTDLVSSVSGDTFVVGGTYVDSTDTLSLLRNDGNFVNITGITDTFVTGFTWNPSTFDLTIEQNNGITDETVNLSILASDVYVLSGVYNTSNGIVTYTNSTGGTFQVSGFTTGMTDTYTTDANLSGNSITFDRNIGGGNVYNVDLLPLLSGKTDNITFNTYTSDTQTILDSKTSGATNLTTTGLFAQKNGDNLEFKGITSTGGSVTITNDSTSVNIEIPIDTNTFVTGFTYNDNNTFTISDNAGSNFPTTINQMSGLTVSGSATITETLQVTNDGTYKFNTNPVTRLSSNGDYYGELLSIGDIGTPTVGNVYYFDSTSVWLLTDVNTSATSKGLIAIATSATAFNVGMLISGYFKNTSWSFTVGNPVYLSVTSGSLSSSQPTGSGDIVRVVGYAIATDEVYFNPSHDWIELV